MLPHPPRISLARLPTPLDPVRAGAALGIDLWCKRDDLTGAALSGNKVRKLEYLLAEAQAIGADTLITCGGEQSNHARATAIAAAQLGLRSVLLLRTEDPARPPPLEANLLLDRLVGAELRWVSRQEYARRGPLLAEVARVLMAEGRRPYVIPEGGSNALGVWGYVGCIEELAAEAGPGPLTVVYAAGSGGTGAGLVLGIKLLGLPWRAVGINVCDDRAYFVRTIGELVEQAIERFSLPVRFDRSELELIDGYVGLGYARSRPEELAALRDLARSDGLVLDPVYTGKAWYGLRSELSRDPRAFGDRVVLLHSGGIFGLFPKGAELAALL